MAFLIAYLSYLVSLIGSMAKAKRGLKKDWDIKIYVTDHFLDIAMAVVCVLVLILTRVQLLEFVSNLGMNIPMDLYLIIVGFLNLVFWKWLTDTAFPKIKKKR